MRFFGWGAPEEPDPPTDWEAGYFCPQIALFVLIYFSCVVAFLAAYNSFVQICNIVFAVRKSGRKSQSLECDSTPAQGFSPLRLLGVLKSQMECLLRAVCGQAATSNPRRSFRLSLKRAVPQSKLRLKHLRRSGRCWKSHVSSEILCHLPRKLLECPHMSEGLPDFDICELHEPQSGKKAGIGEKVTQFKHL